MRKKTIAVGGGILIVALLGAGVWWLFDTGRLVYSAEGSTQAAGAKVVCDSAVVDRYNKAMFYMVREENTEPRIDDEAVNALEKEILADKGYKDDATCQAILFGTAIYHKEMNKARTAADAVKALHNKRVFADSNLRGNPPLFMYDSYLLSSSESE